MEDWRDGGSLTERRCDSELHHQQSAVAQRGRAVAQDLEIIGVGSQREEVGKPFVVDHEGEVPFVGVPDQPVGPIEEDRASHRLQDRPGSGCVAAIGFAAGAGRVAAARRIFGLSAPALWRFGDEDTTIYLFGTIHALPPGYKWRDARLDRAMARSDTLVIETVIDKDPMAIARLFPPPDPTLPPILDRVPAKDRDEFAKQITRSGLDQAALDRMPTWQAAFLMMGALMKDLGIAREAGVENSISKDFAVPPKPGGKPRAIEGLETPASQLALFADLSEDDQRELLTSMATGQSKALNDYVELLNAWTRGDQIAIARSFEDDEDLTPHLREALLRKRNASWAQWLTARLATPGTIFVAVGAGHLAGPVSVQAFLAARGICVRRIYANRANQKRPAC